jgi:hypothetical protein
MDPTLSTPEVMATVFHLCFIIARQIHRMTDIFVEVHPRHSGFYRRMMGYRVVGPERICPRVGAPAVLMQLSLEHAEQEIHRLGGGRGSDERSLYRLFFSPNEQDEVFHQLLAKTNDEDRSKLGLDHHGHRKDHGFGPRIHQPQIAHAIPA